MRRPASTFIGPLKFLPRKRLGEVDSLWQLVFVMSDPEHELYASGMALVVVVSHRVSFLTKL